jgi:hypothetical protein
MFSLVDVTLKIAKTLSRKNIHVLWKTRSKFCFKDTNSGNEPPEGEKERKRVERERIGCLAYTYRPFNST